MNNMLKYGLWAAAAALVGYNSVYFKPLDQVKAAGMAQATTLAADAYAQTFWTAKLRPAASTTATDLSQLMPLLKTDTKKAFGTYSHALGIGNIRYFLVKGEGTVASVDDNAIAVSLPTGETVELATEYIFGNAARDASGILRITDFDNTTDLNNVSAALNDLIRKQVVPPLKTMATPGRKLSFIGALELNQAHPHLDKLTLIPISATSAP